MEGKRTLIKTLKKTGVGAAAAWLARPCKHYRDMRTYLEMQLEYPPTRRQICWCFWDFFRFQLMYRGDLETDYFGAQLYRKSNFVRMESMAHAVRFAWRDSVQDQAHWTVFRDTGEPICYLLMKAQEKTQNPKMIKKIKKTF